MKTPVDVVKGQIIDISPEGVVTIKAHYGDIHTLLKRQYRECYVEMIDSRPLSDKQRKMCWSLINAIAEWQGQSKGETARDMVNQARKLDFMINELEGNLDRMFSLSNAPMSLVAAFQRYLVRFVVEHDIPTTQPMLAYVDDIADYVYACLIHRRCCVCGKYADLHHIDRVGMGRDRADVVHEGMEALPLCREHHGQAHALSDKDFFEKYHLDGGIELDKTLCRIYKIKARRESNGESKQGITDRSAD